MDSQLAVNVRSFLLNQATAIPVAIGAVAVASAVVFRRQLATMRPFGVRESESIMNFAKNGTLRCICGAEHSSSADFADRREFCRSCGGEVVEQNMSLAYKQLSPAEIKVMTRSLRSAAIKSSHLDLPMSVTSIHELNLYLKSNEVKQPRVPPTQPTTLKQPQVH